MDRFYKKYKGYNIRYYEAKKARRDESLYHKLRGKDPLAKSKYYDQLQRIRKFRLEQEDRFNQRRKVINEQKKEYKEKKGKTEQEVQQELVQEILDSQIDSQMNFSENTHQSLGM